MSVYVLKTKWKQKTREKINKTKQNEGLGHIYHGSCIMNMGLNFHGIPHLALRKVENQKVWILKMNIHCTEKEVHIQRTGCAMNGKITFKFHEFDLL